MQLQEAFKLALSFTLFYWFTLSMDWPMPKYGGLAMAVVSTYTVGDSLLKGVMRSVGTIVGAIIGLAFLGLFAQSPTGLMFAVAAMLIVICYFGQTSRYQYAWALAAVVLIIVWSTGYGKPHASFHFAVFRTLETIFGILIYTVVSAVLWPVTAEKRLMAEGRDLWRQITEFGRRIRLEHDAEASDGSTELRHQIAGSLMHLEHTLPSLYADTWATVSRKPVWECLRTALNSLVNEMDHWRLIVQDTGGLEMERHLQGLNDALDTFDARFERFGSLWDTGGADGDPDDERLLEPLSLEEGDITDLTPSRRAVLALYVESLVAVDRASRGVLRCLRTLADLDEAEDFTCRSEPTPLRRPPLWSVDRLLSSLLPAVCWLVGFSLWITFNIPTGQIIALLAAVLGLFMVFHPLPLLELLKWLLVSIWFVVGPVYLFVLPELNSAAELLGVIFVFCFIFAWMGSRKPLLRMTSLVLFPLIIDFSNHQSYSLMKLIVFSMIVVFGIAITLLVYQLLRPLGPVNSLKRELRRYFAACARVIESFGLHDTGEEQGRRLRRVSFQDRILPAPHRLESIAAQLSASELSEDAAHELDRLVEGTGVLALRLEALDYTREQAVEKESRLGALMKAASGSLGERIQGVFENWSRTGDDQQTELAAIDEELHGQIEGMQAVADGDDVSAEELRSFTLLAGSLRGLVSSMSAVNLAIMPVREYLRESSQ